MLCSSWEIWLIYVDPSHVRVYHQYDKIMKFLNVCKLIGCIEVTGLPRACLFWKEMVLYAYDGISLVLSNSSSSASPSSLSDSPRSVPTASASARPLVISAAAASNESSVAQTCHLAARHVTACALWVILVALRSRMKRPVTNVMEHNCTQNQIRI